MDDGMAESLSSPNRNKLKTYDWFMDHYEAAKQWQKIMKGHPEI
jgi:hypothetical protein